MPANTETITVVRPAARDRHGDSGGYAEHQISDVVGAPLEPDENVSRGEQYVERWDLYRVPVDADIQITDRVRRETDPEPGNAAALKVRAPWIVVGAPPWRSPYSDWAPGMVVRIERHTG